MLNSYQEFKMFYSSNIILFVVILFVIIYIIVNWENIHNGKYWNGEFIKPILISGILFLILHIIITWDDDINLQNKENELILPKYKLGQVDNQAKNEIIAANLEIPDNNLNPQQNNKYRIINKYDTINNNSINKNNMVNPTLEQFTKLGQNLSHTDNNKLSNQNIFITQKNSSKYGIKFI